MARQDQRLVEPSPPGCTIDHEGIEEAKPLSDTFSIMSSDPNSPNSARAGNPVFTARLASFPAVALLIVASCNPLALFRNVAGAMTLSGFVASGDASPRPKARAVMFAAATAIELTLA